MNEDLLKILSNSNKDIDNQQLMEYLNGKLSALDRHDIEKMMADSDLMNDAVEGLQGVKDKKDIQVYVDQLNASLQKSLQKKKHRRERRRLKDRPWNYVAILVIVLVCIAAYFIVRRVLLVR